MCAVWHQSSPPTNRGAGISLSSVHSHPWHSEYTRFSLPCLAKQMLTLPWSTASNLSGYFWVMVPFILCLLCCFWCDPSVTLGDLCKVPPCSPSQNPGWDRSFPTCLLVASAFPRLLLLELGLSLCHKVLNHAPSASCQHGYQFLSTTWYLWLYTHLHCPD